ncbi:MAG: hypothetical protein VCB82_08175 [Alphaproteobacteria bacterium]
MKPAPSSERIPVQGVGGTCQHLGGGGGSANAGKDGGTQKGVGGVVGSTADGHRMVTDGVIRTDLTQYGLGR